MQYSCIPCSPDPGNTDPQGWLLVWCTGRAAGEAQIRRNDEHILIPVTGKPEPDELAVLPGADENIAIFEAEFEPKRKRVADMVKPGQYVVDLFAGVGPFSILIGKSVPGESVVVVDKNPEAVKLLREYIRLNRLDNMTAVEHDARHAAGNLKYSADHVIMNLPQSSREFLDSGILAAKNGGCGAL